MILLSGLEAEVTVHPVGFQLFNLLAANWNFLFTTLELTFNRAVNAAGYIAGQLEINDDVDTFRQWRDAIITAQPTPERLNFNMFISGISMGGVRELTTLGNTGIVAADSGSGWSGVVDLPLPFP